MSITEVGIATKGDKEICVVSTAEFGGKSTVRGMADVFTAPILETFVGKWKLGDRGGPTPRGHVWNNEDTT